MAYGRGRQPQRAAQPGARPDDKRQPQADDLAEQPGHERSGQHGAELDYSEVGFHPAEDSLQPDGLAKALLVDLGSSTIGLPGGIMEPAEPAIIRTNTVEDAMTLSAEKCVACRRDSPLVADEEIPELHRQVSDWELTEVKGIKRLVRTYRFRDFAGALDFTGEVGAAAEAEGHHPKLTTEWGKVRVEWWTHKIKGLHRNDFIMAAKTDGLYAGSSGTG